MDRVFLDANVLFSAGYRSDSGLRRLWRRSDAHLITSTYAVEEASRNLPAGERRARLQSLLSSVELVSHAVGIELPTGVALPDKDRPILIAAILSQSTHLVTGDISHFGNYFGKRVGGVEILLPATYLNRSRGS